MKICEYGCGKQANYTFKSGKVCCESSVNRCEGKRHKDSLKKKGRFFGTPFWKIDGFVKTAWNKGKIGVYSEEARKKISIALIGKSKGVANTQEKEKERRRKISETMKRNPNSGGLRLRSGRGKKGWYKGYWCDSSWELAFVIFNIEHQIPFERNHTAFKYKFKKQTRHYHPDFIIDEIYFEIKGRRSYSKLDEENKAKISQFEKKLVVLYESDMSPYLDYVTKKYGKDFTKLYE